MVRRRSAKPVTVVRFRYAPQEDRYCFSAGLLRFGNTHSGGGASTARNTRSSHVLADEITWEQYILKKCPCRPVERCFSETQCSQVGVFEATWEQCVPNNRPYRPLQGRFCKIYCSQVFSPALSAFPPTTFPDFDNASPYTIVSFPDFDNASPYTIVSWGEALQQRFDVLLLRCRE